jgi:hypothetical protein
METIFSLFVYLIWGIIILFHSYGFWHVYNWSFSKWGGLSIIIRGLMAGLTPWFWVCLLVGFWNSNSGGNWMGLIWIYGLIFVPVIGLFFTLIFRTISKEYRLIFDLWSRMFFGAVIGMFPGIIFALLVLYPRPTSGDSFLPRLISMMIIFGSIGLASGVMSGERGLND